VVHDGAVPRWTLGDGALYVDTQDTPAVARAVRQALDPAAGRALGRKARDRMTSGWSWQVLAAKYRAFFYELAGARASQAPRPGGG
jgi:glycosyltransferase involved in cell wall biosynthesis